MICVAISDKDYRKCIGLLTEVEMAEIRLDLTGYDDETIDAVFAQNVPLIATCRPDNLGEQQQYFKLRRAIEAGAGYVDIEIEASEEQKKALIDEARKYDCKIIISYHNYDETPGMRELYKIADNCYNMGADVAKIATMVNKPADNARLLALYAIEKPIVAIGMGEIGKVSRIIAPLLGAEFTFVAEDNSEGTAPGQISYSKMKDLLRNIDNILSE